MKAMIGIHGATAVPPDFAMLKAALASAQAATRTAHAAARPHATPEPRGALHDLLVGYGSAAAHAAALGHRFHRGTAEQGAR